MRSLLLTAALFISSLTIALGQYMPPPPDDYFFANSEVLIGHGFLPSEQMFSGASSRLSYSNDHYSGSIFATYRYHITEGMSLGLTMAYEYEQGTWNKGLYLFGPGNSYEGRFHRSALTVAPELTFTYCDYADGLVRLYGAVGMGYTFRNEKVTYGNANAEYNTPYAAPIHFNAYGSPLGIRFGRELSGFFELGLGYKGLFNYGLTYRF